LLSPKSTVFLAGGKPQQDEEKLKFRQVLEVSSLRKFLSLGMVGVVTDSLCNALLV
jgi:hypothetical protein